MIVEGKRIDFIGDRLCELLLDFLFEVLNLLLSGIESLLIDDFATGGSGAEKVGG